VTVTSKLTSVKRQNASNRCDVCRSLETCATMTYNCIRTQCIQEILILCYHLIRKTTRFVMFTVKCDVKVDFILCNYCMRCDFVSSWFTAVSITIFLASKLSLIWAEIFFFIFFSESARHKCIHWCDLSLRTEQQSDTYAAAIFMTIIDQPWSNQQVGPETAARKNSWFEPCHIHCEKW